MDLLLNDFYLFKYINNIKINNMSQYKLFIHLIVNNTKLDKKKNFFSHPKFQNKTSTKQLI